MVKFDEKQQKGTIMKIKKFAFMIAVLLVISALLVSCAKSPEVGKWKTSLSLTNNALGGGDSMSQLFDSMLTGGNGIDLYLELDGENYEFTIDAEALKESLKSGAGTIIDFGLSFLGGSSVSGIVDNLVDSIYKQLQNEFANTGGTSGKYEVKNDVIYIVGDDGGYMKLTNNNTLVVYENDGKVLYEFKRVK